MSNVEPGIEGNEPAAPPASGAPDAPANPQAPPQGQQPAPKPGEQRPTAAGGQPPPGEPPAWRPDWREAMAKATSTDEKSYAKELKRLERYADPTAVNAARASLE